METITIPRFFDAHVHFRRQSVMHAVAPITADYCSHAVVMPNTVPRPIVNSDEVLSYRGDIMAEIEKSGYGNLFQPLMTIKIRDDTTPEIVGTAHGVGAVAGKVYPKGVTTNSDDGLTDFFSKNMIEVFGTMEELDMILLLHGETDEERILVTEREKMFLPMLRTIAKRYPKLKIVLEHVSSRKGVIAINEMPNNVAATITAHHMVMTLNDVIGNKIRPHNGCMPMPKTFEDRDSLILAAISGNPKFFLGSDSAPHLRERKECSKGECGVFTSPILPELLVQIFEENNALDKLEGFTSGFGARFYGLEPSKETITLMKAPWTVPEEFDGIVPFLAGRELSWQFAT